MIGGVRSGKNRAERMLSSLLLDCYYFDKYTKYKCTYIIVGWIDFHKEDGYNQSQTPINSRFNPTPNGSPDSVFLDSGTEKTKDRKGGKNSRPAPDLFSSSAKRQGQNKHFNRFHDLNHNTSTSSRRIYTLFYYNYTHILMGKKNIPPPPFSLQKAKAKTPHTHKRTRTRTRTHAHRPIQNPNPISSRLLSHSVPHSHRIITHTTHTHTHTHTHHTSHKYK